jgi:hypothetical protein
LHKTANPAPEARYIFVDNGTVPVISLQVSRNLKSSDNSVQPLIFLDVPGHQNKSRAK